MVYLGVSVIVVLENTAGLGEIEALSLGGAG
jgi:hypothetical protein